MQQLRSTYPLGEAKDWGEKEEGRGSWGSSWRGDQPGEYQILYQLSVYLLIFRRPCLALYLWPNSGKDGLLKKTRFVSRPNSLTSEMKTNISLRLKRVPENCEQVSLLWSSLELPMVTLPMSMVTFPMVTLLTVMPTSPMEVASSWAPRPWVMEVSQTGPTESTWTQTEGCQSSKTGVLRSCITGSMGRPIVIYRRGKNLFIEKKTCYKVGGRQLFFFSPIFEGRRLELEPIAGPKKRGTRIPIFYQIDFYINHFLQSDSARAPVIFYIFSPQIENVSILGLLSSLNNHKSGKVVTLRWGWYYSKIKVWWNWQKTFQRRGEVEGRCSHWT